VALRVSRDLASGMRLVRCGVIDRRCLLPITVLRSGRTSRNAEEPQSGDISNGEGLRLDGGAAGCNRLLVHFESDSRTSHSAIATSSTNRSPGRVRRSIASSPGHTSAANVGSTRCGRGSNRTWVATTIRQPNDMPAGRSTAAASGGWPPGSVAMRVSSPPPDCCRPSNPQ
jgi:hypothetical protein